MANGAALIRESIWRNREFRALPRAAQCTYIQVCSQRDLDCAGLLTLNIGVLVKGCSELDQDAIMDDLKTLEAERFVFVDHDTDELFIRSYMRTAEVVRSPNVFKSAIRSAAQVHSPKLRIEVAAELRRLKRAEATKIADQLDPSETHRGNATNPSETLPKSETLTEPSYPYPDPSQSHSCAVGPVGEGTRPQCADHEENHDGPCHACRRRREWDRDNAGQIEAAEREQRRAAQAAADQVIRDCRLCDDGAWRLGEDGTPMDPAVKCDHPETANA
ncbi:hypothetical protein [[Mycobacterium] crassicus]|uniref:Uncharacterized protein n=1 Tax=[Mycobacterium] crassicus TaxID=2872309 RepID=A0ABU5XG97_9MYCO|nr:hypothetical protein [Mycolicibacter sp. MYC098]MEB3021289.1 hypothetical protein [Mycolicibacter sp. MYC098]